MLRLVHSVAAGGVVRFATFELDVRSEELRRDGVRIPLARQSLQALALLLEQPGELVTRDALRQRLWPAGTHVDFEHGLNAVIKRLRAALGDSVEAPRFIETLARRGYRFIAPVAGSEVGSASGSGQAASRSRPLALLAAALAAAFAIRAFWPRSPRDGRE